MAHAEYAACIEACNDCAVACDHCAGACLAEIDVKLMSWCIELNIDCAGICRLLPSYMARDSGFAPQLCQLCAEVCEACAEVCAMCPQEHCQDCAAACRHCADECRRMPGSAVAPRHRTSIPGTH